MNILYGLIAGVVAYLVANLVFSDPISLLLGLIVFCAVAFGFPGANRRY